MMTDKQKLEALLRHKDNVLENCELLAAKLMEHGEVQFALALIAAGFNHDNSKFRGIEWDFMDPQTSNRTGLKYAVGHHSRTNQHHPEYWGSIDKMPDLYVAEMVCDWKARSTEFGNSLRDWIDKEATKKFKFTKDSAVYKKIMAYVDLILDKPFDPIEDEARTVKITSEMPELKNECTQEVRKDSQTP